MNYVLSGLWTITIRKGSSITASRKTALCLELEAEGKNGYREQAEYNRYAPVLMTSVDTDPALCAEERKAVMQKLVPGKWKIFGSHGAMKEYDSL